MNLKLILYIMFFILKGLYHLSYAKIRKKGKDKIVVNRVQYDVPKDNPIKSGLYLCIVNNIAINRKASDTVCENYRFWCVKFIYLHFGRRERSSVHFF